MARFQSWWIIGQATNVEFADGGCAVDQQERAYIAPGKLGLAVFRAGSGGDHGQQAHCNLLGSGGCQKVQVLLPDEQPDSCIALARDLGAQFQEPPRCSAASDSELVPLPYRPTCGPESCKAPGYLSLGSGPISHDPCAGQRDVELTRLSATRPGILQRVHPLAFDAWFGGRALRSTCPPSGPSRQPPSTPPPDRSVPS